MHFRGNTAKEILKERLDRRWRDRERGRERQRESEKRRECQIDREKYKDYSRKSLTL